MHNIYKIDEKKIEEAIADFESHVNCELVPVITPRSSYVEHIGWMISLVLLIIFVFSIDLIFHDTWASLTWVYMAAPLVAIALGFLLDKSDWIDRFFISKHEQKRQTFEKAQRIFFLKRLNETKTQNALLIFISVLEKRIVLLPDPRLEIKTTQQLQNKILDALKTEFRKSHYEDGFLKAIQLLKEELSPLLPKNKQNSNNELPNKLIWWNE